MIKILSNLPTCANSFKNFCYSDRRILNIYVNKLMNVRPFDVTLRDGIQGLSKNEQQELKTIDKFNMYCKIVEKYQPKNMEIGSIVSSKLLPVFNDSESLYNYIKYYQSKNLDNVFCPNSNNFILIPNEKQFQNINKFNSLSNFSFITSVSESFQMKNTKMTLDETFQQLNNMFCILNNRQQPYTTKLYVSCINECPIEGKIDNNIIIEKLYKYQSLNPDILCLSDTCGTLTKNDFVYIISRLYIDKTYNNLSLHLHVKPDREDEVEKIIHAALDFGIKSFDVSALETGGCSVTMSNFELVPNLSYELYYKSLATYLVKYYTL